MTNQTTALQIARGMMENGMSVADANVEVVRMMGVRVVSGKIDRGTRSALAEAVKAGRLGHLKRDGLKPEAFFHPNAEAAAREERSKIANAGIRAIQACCA
jgi:esterase/lipase superfamily enzyme